MDDYDPLDVEKALTEGFEYDLFVSYARYDNLVPEGANGPGWVTRLTRNLNSVQSALRKRIFIDNQLKPGDPFNDALKAKVAKSAILVLLLSREYVESEWCGIELEHFIQARSNDPLKPRNVVVVELLPFQRLTSVPDTLSRIRSQLLHCKLWYWSRGNQGNAEGMYRLAGSPSPATDDDKGTHYWREVEALVQAIDDRLIYLKSGTQQQVLETSETLPAAQSSSSPQPRAVLVADVTEDLDSKRSELVAALAKEHISVLPEGDYYGLDSEQLCSRLRGELDRSALFVQLLSEAPGRKPPGALLRLPQLQLQAARESGVPIMQWQEPGLDVGSIRDADHAALFRSSELHVVNLERFKDEVIRRHGELTSPRPTSPTARRGTRRIFLDDPGADKELRDQICEVLSRHQCEVRSPLNGEAHNPDTLTEMLRTCRGGITVYRDPRDRKTVSFRLMRYLNLIAQQELEVARWGVWLGTPPARNNLYAELGIASNALVPIPGFAGLDEAALVRFVESVPAS